MSASTPSIRDEASRGCVVIINASREGACTLPGGIQKPIIGQIAAFRASSIEVHLSSTAHRRTSIAGEVACTIH